MADILKKIKTKKTGNQIKNNLLMTLAPKEISTDQKVIFSFEIFDRNCEYFNLGETCSAWYISLLDVLKEISKYSWKEFVQKYKEGTYDPHQFSKKSLHEYKLQDFEEIKDNAWQFRINKSLGRVHGLLINNIFYIYWLDPHHNMINSEGYQKSRALKPPENCECNLFINKLKKDYEEQKNIIRDISEEIIDNYEELFKILSVLKEKEISIKEFLEKVKIE